MSEDNKSGLGGHANDLISLVIAYAKQETLGPLKSVGRYIAFGLAGALLFAIGGVLLALAALRAIQTEAGRHLAGNLSWVPYAGAVLLCAIGMTWAVVRIVKGDKALGAKGER
jgi:uncharacterized membrane protein